MPLVEITEKQEKVLDETEFACLVSERNNLTYEISILQIAKALVFKGKTKGDLQVDIMNRQVRLSKIGIKLKNLRQKLGIETPTIHTEL
jgi:hypothetical protein